ncbi:MAG: ATP-binding cassette domain-containing protein [Spirochaetales bacterium]|nr:ATP-binding cassette domain-containing protein [Spirochaetales bacterium]
MDNDFILEFDSVTKDFPGIRALSEVTFKVRRGEIHGICGENGAGKSTLMKIITGVYPYLSYEGHVFFNGEELKFTGSSIRKAIEKGIAIVYQELALIPQMTVGENIFLGREPVTGGVINWHDLYSRTLSLMDRYGLSLPLFLPVGVLGVGQQQLVEIVKALSENAKLLILDEPTSALTENEIESLLSILKTLKKNGVTCIYISHKIEEFFAIADTITVLRDGKTIDTVKITDTSMPRIITMMVGRELKERFPKQVHKKEEVVFEVDGLTAFDPNKPDRPVIQDVSFSLHRGEILGIAGLMGSGRTELVMTLFGEYGINISGSLLLEGRPYKIRSARYSMNNGISFVPENRKEQGLVLNQSILENLSLPNISAFSTVFSINKHEEITACQAISRKLSIKYNSITAEVASLSGGNQQKVVIAKWLISDPLILILDEPTRGIDVGAKYEIYKLMNSLAASGVAIIMVSSELPEILALSDTIIVMHNGRSTGILAREEATQEKIMRLAAGCENSVDEDCL